MAFQPNSYIAALGNRPMKGERDGASPSTNDGAARGPKQTARSWKASRIPAGSTDVEAPFVTEVAQKAAHYELWTQDFQKTRGAQGFYNAAIAAQHDPPEPTVAPTGDS